MLGEEQVEEGEDEFDLRQTEGGGVSRFSQRAVTAPQRLKTELEAAQAAPAASKKTGDKKGAKDGGVGEDGEVVWTKVQLQNVLTGIFSLGYGRTETLQARNASLQSRPTALVAEAVDYACSLGMSLTRSAEAEREAAGVDAAAGPDDDGDPERERRLWHFLQTGRPPLPLAPLVPQPIIKPLLRQMAEW